LPNRLISKTFLVDLDSVLRDCGSLVLKTDHAEYFDWSIAQIEALHQHFELTVASHDFWNDPDATAQSKAHEFAGESSAFEDRFRRKRKPIYYLRARRRVVNANP
jgi:tRNA G46 methylase TrmB